MNFEGIITIGFMIVFVSLAGIIIYRIRKGIKNNKGINNESIGRHEEDDNCNDMERTTSLSITDKFYIDNINHGDD